MNDSRDWNSKEYKQWRLAVKKRDGFRCRFPGCKSRKKLKCHHIKRWADFPGLRFKVENGCTLCATHHNMVNGKEEEYAAVLISILGGKDLAMEIILAKYGGRPRG